MNKSMSWLISQPRFAATRLHINGMTDSGWTVEGADWDAEVRGGFGFALVILGCLCVACFWIFKLAMPGSMTSHGDFSTYLMAVCAGISIACMSSVPITLACSVLGNSDSSCIIWLKPGWALMVHFSREALLLLFPAAVFYRESSGRRTLRSQLFWTFVEAALVWLVLTGILSTMEKLVPGCHLATCAGAIVFLVCFSEGCTKITKLILDSQHAPTPKLLDRAAVKCMEACTAEMSDNEDVGAALRDEAALLLKLVRLRSPLSGLRTIASWFISLSFIFLGALIVLRAGIQLLPFMGRFIHDSGLGRDDNLGGHLEPNVSPMTAAIDSILVMFLFSCSLVGLIHALEHHGIASVASGSTSDSAMFVFVLFMILLGIACPAVVYAIGATSSTCKV